jgi:hypothetical protein
MIFGGVEMQAFVLSTVMLLALYQPGINEPRKALVECLKQASAKASGASVPSADYAKFAATECAAKADALRSGLVNFDVKNGIKRAQATTDAQMQIDDYVAMSAEKYEASHPKP